MDVIGYALFIMMGLTFGLVGAGGAILTIPILVYFEKVPPFLATSYSLFIVACTALFGVTRYWRSIVPQRAFLFALPSVSGVFLMRFFLLHQAPVMIGGYHRDRLVMALLIVFMVVAAIFMLRGNGLKSPHQTLTLIRKIQVMSLGFVLGLAMGILGAGGGFLIIPVLVLWMDFEMRQAIATSLLVVFFNTSVGFLADRYHLTPTQYQHLFIFVGLATLGMWLGTHLNLKLPEKALKKVFGWFIMLVAIMMAVKEFF